MPKKKIEEITTKFAITRTSDDGTEIQKILFLHRPTLDKLYIEAPLAVIKSYNFQFLYEKNEKCKFVDIEEYIDFLKDKKKIANELIDKNGLRSEISHD